MVREACLLRLLAEANSERGRLNGRQASSDAGWGDGAVIMTWTHRRKKIAQGQDDAKVSGLEKLLEM